MKRGIWITSIILVLLFIIVSISGEFFKPKITYAESLDNSSGIVDASNEEFFIKKGDTGILLIHGLGATPQEMRLLSDYLVERNITVYAVRLKGHGTNLRDFEKSTWQDWYENVFEGYKKLKQETRKVYVLGVSSGASLSLYLASQEELNGLILIATPKYFRDEKTEIVFILKYLMKYTYTGIDSKNIGHAYENLPLRTFAEFMELVDESSEVLGKVEEPALIIQSNNDNLIYPQSAQYIYDNLLSDKKGIMWLSYTSHAVIREYDNESIQTKSERENVFKKIYEFLK